MAGFNLKSDYKPAGDQPKAIARLVDGIRKGLRYQTLLGVTGSGKTFTMANVIAAIQRPTLVIVHNKTLAAQLTQEYRSFFPDNAVEYFVSYYDYYQPEAYIPQTDTYIEKESSINDEIDRLRHAATQAILTRRDAIVVASVSAIYNIGPPQMYEEIVLDLAIGQEIKREALISRLVEMHFVRNDAALSRGTFRARGPTLEIVPANREIIYQVTLVGDRIAKITQTDMFKSKNSYFEIEHLRLYPAKHYVTDKRRLEQALYAIQAEMLERTKILRSDGEHVAADRLERRTKYDLELMSEVGYCNGIENYSRFFDGRKAGDPPHALLEYFPKNFLLTIDESHVTIPQIRGMPEGDKSRKQTLIDFGFRLPSALDNRPLKFDEFEKQIGQVVFTSATPAAYELEKSQQIVEQIVRPTGLADPELILLPTQNQIEDLRERITGRTAKGERTLITTLTKKMAEDLSTYLEQQSIKVHYLHSDVQTLDRIETLTNLRSGVYDVLVGVNLLREGLDLPEVSLVAILDADKEGFLRSQTSLIQTIGRAARNVSGQVVLYADTITGSMRRAIDETNRRRKIQLEYNKKHGITPKPIKKEIKDIAEGLRKVQESKKVREMIQLERIENVSVPQLVKQKEREMTQAAKNLEFELAALLRDEIIQLKVLSKN